MSFDYHKDFVVPLFSGDFDEYLDGMIDSIRYRQKDIAPKARDFKVGDRVRYNEHVRPKYMAGVEGVIQKINRTKVTVQLDSSQGRFYGPVNTPPSLLEKV